MRSLLVCKVAVFTKALGEKKILNCGGLTRRWNVPSSSKHWSSEHSRRGSPQGDLWNLQHVVNVISPVLLFATKSCSAIKHWIEAQPTEGANMMPGDMKRPSAAQSLNSPAVFRRGTSQKTLKSKK